MTRPPTIDLVVGYHKLKHPQFLRTFLSKMASRPYLKNPKARSVRAVATSRDRNTCNAFTLPGPGASTCLGFSSLDVPPFPFTS
jgi:hypothetical protein